MKKVLIIDDNPINNSKYIDELKKVYDVTVALRMLSAIRLLKKSTWDVVVIDVMMPTQILSTNNEMKAGFDFYEQEVKNFICQVKLYFGLDSMNLVLMRLNTQQIKAFVLFTNQ